MALKDLTLANSSPLVLKAKQYLENNNQFIIDDVTYAKWEVLTKAHYF